jgi:transposase
MERVIERCGGLDVPKKTVAACVRVPGSHSERVQQVRTFGTTAGELRALREWLARHGVTHVAMESTGVYWKPIFYALEDAFTCVLANAAQIAQVPGRKTDVKDCVWIAQLLEHGLIPGELLAVKAGTRSDSAGLGRLRCPSALSVAIASRDQQLLLRSRQLSRNVCIGVFP